MAKHGNSIWSKAWASAAIPWRTSVLIVKGCVYMCVPSLKLRALVVANGVCLYTRIGITMPRIKRAAQLRSMRARNAALTRFRKEKEMLCSADDGKADVVGFCWADDSDSSAGSNVPALTVVAQSVMNYNIGYEEGYLEKNSESSVKIFSSILESSTKNVKCHGPQSLERRGRYK